VDLIWNWRTKDCNRPISQIFSQTWGGLVEKRLVEKRMVGRLGEWENVSGMRACLKTFRINNPHISYSLTPLPHSQTVSEIAFPSPPQAESKVSQLSISFRNFSTGFNSAFASYLALSLYFPGQFFKFNLICVISGRGTVIVRSGHCRFAMQLSRRLAGSLSNIPMIITKEKPHRLYLQNQTSLHSQALILSARNLQQDNTVTA
jgi:hypothetical protein